MSQQLIDTGNGLPLSGDTAPAAGAKINANFTELYNTFPGGVPASGLAAKFSDATAIALVKPDTTKLPLIVSSVSAPSAPIPGALWLSASVRTLQVSSASADRTALLTGAAGGFENGFCQEPSVFYNTTAGNWGMVYGGTTGLGYATAPSPFGPWTKRGKILGGGTGGFAGAVDHARAVVVGGLLYITFPDFTNNQFRITNGAALPTGTNVPVFTTNSVIFTVNTGALGITSTLLGNSRIVQAGATWYLFWEAFKTGVGWQIGTATCATFNGTYALGTYPHTTLQTVSATANACGGPMPLYENGAFTLYYHSGGGASTKIYRAFSADGTNNWTIDNNGLPWLDARLPNEVSQVADICIVASPSGDYYAYWDAINNNTVTGVGAINGAPVALPLYMYDTSYGGAWTPVSGLPKSEPQYFNWLRAGSPYLTNATAVNHECAVFDTLTAGSNLTCTLPVCDIGSRVRVVNGSSSGSFTVAIVASVGDAITSPAITLGVGQYCDYECFLPNNWSRLSTNSYYGTGLVPSGSALNIGGIFQKLQAGFVTIYAADGNTSNLDRRSGGSASTAYLAPANGTVPCISQASTTPDIANSGTVATSNVGMSRYTPAGARTALVMQAGTYEGQQVWVVNESGANSMTFAASGTSNVATGTSAVVAALKAKQFIWNTATSLWYETN